MNIARANQVLNDILDSISNIDGECERLCLLISEVLQNKYWKLRYKSVVDFGEAMFGSFSAFRALRSLANSYDKQHYLLSELGRNKCKSLIPVIRNEGAISDEWLEIARSTNAVELNLKVRELYPAKNAPKCELHFIKNRIGRLNQLIKKYQDELNDLHKRLSNIEKKVA